MEGIAGLLRLSRRCKEVIHGNHRRLCSIAGCQAEMSDVERSFHDVSKRRDSHRVDMKRERCTLTPCEALCVASRPRCLIQNSGLSHWLEKLSLSTSSTQTRGIGGAARQSQIFRCVARAGVSACDPVELGSTIVRRERQQECASMAVMK